MANILVVDDDPLILRTIGRVLRGSGHSVVEVDRAERALAYLDANKPDLMITDIVMPEQDGLSLLQQVHALHPGVVTLVISGGGETTGSEFMEMAKSLGARQTLKKPFDILVLLNAVNDLSA
jgi:DNA-binding response OmpR family regulator